jgi:hypothetical protein
MKTFYEFSKKEKLDERIVRGEEFFSDCYNEMAKTFFDCINDGDGDIAMDIIDDILGFIQTTLIEPTTEEGLDSAEIFEPIDKGIINLRKLIKK